MSLKEEIIAVLVKERTRGRDIAYEFMKNNNKRAKEFSNHESLKRKYDHIANESRQIGNAVSGSNALSSTLGETIEDRVRREYDEEIEKILKDGKM